MKDGVAAPRPACGGSLLCFVLCIVLEETFSMDASQFNVIYPSYLDSTKTISEGRRIGQEVAVEVPTVSDISQALQSLNIRHVLQPNKGYSRDIETLWDNPGRVKVDNTSQFETKRKLLKELAKIIVDLPARQQRLEQAKQQALLEQQKAEEAALKNKQAHKAIQQQQQQQQQQQPQQQRAATSKSTNKKKGKKKK